MSIIIRKIEERDNEQLAGIIKQIFDEYELPKEGTVYNDPTTNNLNQLFQKAGSLYWVAEEDGQLLGGCGIYLTPGLPDKFAELVKFYLQPAARGKGIGKLLMEKCCVSAKELGYQYLYLESFHELLAAVSLYESGGFCRIDHALGNSGHYACNIWMVKHL